MCDNMDHGFLVMKKDKVYGDEKMRVLEEVDTILDIYVKLKIRNALGIQIHGSLKVKLKLRM